jgi:Protein of unknown function (DUF2934)
MEIEQGLAKSGTPDATIAASSNAAGEESDGSWASHDELIRARAYELFCARGGQDGDDVSDWLRAEVEYRERFQKGGGAAPLLS